MSASSTSTELDTSTGGGPVAPHHTSSSYVDLDSFSDFDQIIKVVSSLG